MNDDRIKRTVSKRQRLFLRKELQYWDEHNMITAEQRQALDALYVPHDDYFMPVLLGLGALCVGLGVLSLIASNWIHLSRLFRVILLISGYVGAVLSAYALEPRLPKTARGALAISSFMYGGGIFLIAQMFHDGGHYTDALLWWIIGLFPVAFFFKDRFQLLLMQFLSLYYLYGVFHLGDSVLPNALPFIQLNSVFALLIPLSVPLLLITLLGLAHWIDNRWVLGFNINLFLLFNWIAIYCLRLGGPKLAIPLSFIAFAGGLIAFFARGHFKKELAHFGIFLFAAATFLLSFDEFWSILARGKHLASIISSVLAAGILLYFVRAGYLIASFFFCALVLRFYFDTFFSFMPKGLFFVTAGLLLLSMGYFIERTRRKTKNASRKEGNHDEII